MRTNLRAFICRLLSFAVYPAFRTVRHTCYALTHNKKPNKRERENHVPKTDNKNTMDTEKKKGYNDKRKKYHSQTPLMPIQRLLQITCDSNPTVYIFCDSSGFNLYLIWRTFHLQLCSRVLGSTTHKAH